MADEIKVTVLKVEKTAKDAGGYRPARRWVEATKEYVPDYQARGSYDPDERGKKSRIYVQTKDWSVLENLINRDSRPIALYRKALPAMFAELGIEPIKVKWSRNAGCGSCSCSPGFIVDAALGYDVWLTIAVEGADGNVDPALAEIAENRLAQVLRDPTIAPLIQS